MRAASPSALVPDEDAGVLSYLASRALSSLQFKRHGLVVGDDVLSVLSRAEYYLNEKDLDKAARELNQLKGPAKTLVHDWLEAARKRLEVQQALDVWLVFTLACYVYANRSVTGRTGASNTSFFARCVAMACFTLTLPLDS